MMPEMTYFRVESVIIVSRSDSELEVQRYGMKTNTWVFDCWSYPVGRWTMNQTMWKNVPKPLKFVFLENDLQKPSFRFLNF